MSTIIRCADVWIIGCLKAQEEVLEIVKKKMEEVNSTNAPMPKVKYFIKISSRRGSNLDGWKLMDLMPLSLYW